ncbi:MAG TPA: MDR family MFS transporter [Dehalococcoidia bacterium]|nr:MDR family MFS transporter [Dehalococcoidia bacterium]
MRRLDYKWLVGIVFAFGMFMNLLDTTIVNVALPTFAREFNASTTTIEWVVTAYLLALAVFIPMSGWVGDRFGTKRTFMAALAAFTLGSLLCALSQNIHELIAFRVIQGMGGGMLMPVGMAMVFRAFAPSERAAAGALVSIPTAVAPAAGPVLGGYLVEYQSWPWIFLINIPIGILAIVFAGLVLREERQPRPGRLDVPGFLLSSAGLAVLMYALAEGGTRGLDDPRVILMALAGLALLALFAVVEMRTEKPLLDLRLFRDPLFRAVSILWIPGQAAFVGALFLVPLLLQLEMGFSPLESGLATFPQAVGIAMIAPVMGRVYPHVGPRRLVMAGMVGLCLTTLSFLLIGLETGAWWIRLIMLLRGMSFGLVMVPAAAAAYVTIPPQDTGRATAIGSAIPQVGASFGVALMATVLSRRLITHGAVLVSPATRSGALMAFHDAFVVAAVLPVVAIFAALLISDRMALAAGRERERAPPPDLSP